MQNRCSSGEHRDALLVRHEARIRDRDSVFKITWMSETGRC
jgi:hypothetical protein